MSEWTTAVYGATHDHIWKREPDPFLGGSYFETDDGTPIEIRRCIGCTAIDIRAVQRETADV